MTILVTSTALFALSISLAASSAQAQAMAMPIIAIEGDPGTFSYGKVEAALSGMRYKGKVYIVRSEGDLNKVWADRDKYAIIWMGYHALRDNAWLRDWLTREASALEAWVREGGTLLATIKDAEDEPLAAIFGLYKIHAPPEVDEIPLTPGTPFAEGVPDLKLSSRDGFCTWVFSEPLPEWVQYIVATKDDAPAIVAGKYGKGCLILGTAEWVDTTTAYMPGTDDWDPFWRNIFNWIAATSEWRPPEEYYTKTEVDALIREAIEEAVRRAVAEVPPPTTAMALGAAGLVLGLIAIALSIMALRRK